MTITIPKIIDEDYVFTISKYGDNLPIDDPMYMSFLQYIYQKLTPGYLAHRELNLKGLFEKFQTTFGLNQSTYRLDLDVNYDYESDYFLKNPALDLNGFLNSAKVYGINAALNLNGLSITKIMEKNGIERDITTKGFTPVSFGFIGESPDDK
jgi:hypothetical protein